MGVGICCCDCAVTFSGSFANCFQNYAGATITVKDHATGTVYWTGTTDALGRFSGSLSAGPYSSVDIVGVATNGDTATLTRGLACGANTVGQVLVKIQRVTFTAGGQCGNVTGCTITLSGGPTAGSCTTPACGTIGTQTCTLDLAPGTYTFTATASRYVTRTGTFTVGTNCVVTAGTNCTVAAGTANVAFTMSAASGYACIPALAGYPLPMPLHASFLGGSFTLQEPSPGAGYLTNTAAATLNFPAQSGTSCCTSSAVSVNSCCVQIGGSPTFGNKITFDGTGICPVVGATNGGSFAFSDAAYSGSCAPLNATFTWSYTGAGPCTWGPFVMTITE